jgi:hypothetical protein
MAMLPPANPAAPSGVLPVPDADHLEGPEVPVDVHAWLEGTTFELDAPELAGVPFN